MYWFSISRYGNVDKLLHVTMGLFERDFVWIKIVLLSFGLCVFLSNVFCAPGLFTFGSCDLAVSVSFPGVSSALTLGVGIASSVISFQHMLVVNLVLSVAAFAVVYVLIAKVFFFQADAIV